MTFRLEKLPPGPGSLALLLALAGGPARAAAPSVVNVELDERGGGEVLRLDKASVPAGEVTFNVKNASMMNHHEMIVAKIPLTPDKFPTNKDKSKVDEKKFKGAKEVSDIKPSGDGKLTMKLTPGHYVLFCNIKNHFKDGMYAELNVTE
jgi:uncharacterized cupredoxin-like copper-binding protein